MKHSKIAPQPLERSKVWNKREEQMVLYNKIGSFSHFLCVFFFFHFSILLELNEMFAVIFREDFFLKQVKKLLTKLTRFTVFNS